MINEEQDKTDISDAELFTTALKELLDTKPILDTYNYINLFSILFS